MGKIFLFIVFFSLMIFFPKLFLGVEVYLFWDPTTTNEDGTPLTDLAGFKIYYGTMSQNYDYSVDVGNVLTAKIINLEAGRNYCFVATAYNSQNLESRFSNEVCKVSRDTPLPTITADWLIPLFRFFLNY